MSGPAVDSNIDSELVGDDVGHGRFAESRRTIEQHVIHRLAALPGGLHRDLELRFYVVLSDILREAPRPETRIERKVLVGPPGGNKSLVHGTRDYISQREVSRIEQLLNPDAAGSKPATCPHSESSSSEFLSSFF